MKFGILGVIVLVFGGILMMAFRGAPVEVPPAHVGKVLTPEGFTDGVIPPSKFRLDPCLFLCDNLVIAETSDYATTEQMRVFMPKDELNLTVDVRGIYAVSSEAEVADRIFDRLPATFGGDRTSRIPMQQVYNTYAAQVIRETVRSIMTDYTIAQVMSNREEIGNRLFEEVRNELRKTPITVVQFGLADMQPPSVVIQAQELAKEREIAIRQAESQKQIRLKETEAEIELAEKDKIVRLKRAEAILAENKKVAESVSEKYLMYRYLEVIEEAARNEATIFFPLDMTDSAGLHNRIFNTKK